ncbi:hypothetical protein QCA50_008443 [Cerrena zonata]|uniref:RNA-dependent RNA polymerase n=1 Tax=Cerrena zonata TaxID=2478898 RepID=A0AAW0G2Y5_9APHY
MSEELLSEANLNPLARTRSSDSVGTQSTQGTQSTRYTDDPEFDDVIRNYREPELECADEEFTSPKIEREPLVTSTPDEFDGLFEDISSFTATQLLEAENGPPDSGTSLGKRTSSELSGSSMRPYKAWKASHPSPPDSPSHTTGTEIAPIVITPPDCPHLPIVISLPWGVQWELARIAKGLFNKTSDNRVHLDHILKSLHGQPNKVAAPKVPRVAKCLDAKDPLSEWNLAKDDPGDKRATLETEVKSPWSELDVEERILKKHQFGCLGCNENNPDIIAAGADTPHWYGGKVNFAATLVEKNRNFSISLEKPFLSSSSRFYRRFGSSRFIRVSIPKTLVFGSGSSVIKFFQSPVIIWNHVFRAFYHKDHTVFLFQTNEQYQEGKVITPDGPSTHGLSFLDFLSWHNDLEVNHNQSMAKWAARLALGLSNSIPVMRIDPKNYHLIDDIYSPMHDPIRDGKAPSNMEMTDGCGLANAAFFKVIQQRLGLDHSPTAVQCRLQGMKGLFLLHPDHINSAVGEPTVWVRPSQTKIRYHPEVLVDPDPALFTLDLLRTSHMSSPARLSGETIVNMAENGVHSGVFINLMKEQLWECVEKLIFWASDVNNGVTRKSEDVLRLLRANVEKDGSVPRVLLARQNPGTARAYGFVADDLRKDKNQELELDDEDDMGELDKVFPEESMAWWPDPNSGCPSALHETVLTLLDAGFSPSENDYLRNKLREVVRMAITRHTNKFHFDVMHSCTAFIVPW